MTTVVIGAAGQLGTDLVRALPGRVVGLTHRDVDITDGLGVFRALRAHRPDWVINTAAFHRVDDCERNPSLAFAVNAIGAQTVARAAVALAARSVFISTDYVFGGDSGFVPYVEQDTPHPVNVYGVSKLAGEQLVQQADPAALIVRTAGLYGLHPSGKGWTFPDLMLQKAVAGETLRVVTDQILSPTFTADVVEAIERLLTSGASGLYHLVNEGACSWYDFAHATLDLVGSPAVCVPRATLATNHDGVATRRPAYSALTSSRGAPLRPWRVALADYLAQKYPQVAA